jgi:hypothetical protein
MKNLEIKYFLQNITSNMSKIGRNISIKYKLMLGNTIHHKHTNNKITNNIIDHNAKIISMSDELYDSHCETFFYMLKSIAQLTNYCKKIQSTNNVDSIEKLGKEFQKLSSTFWTAREFPTEKSINDEIAEKIILECTSLYNDNNTIKNIDKNTENNNEETKPAFVDIIYSSNKHYHFHPIGNFMIEMIKNNGNRRYCGILIKNSKCFFLYTKQVCISHHKYIYKVKGILEINGDNILHCKPNDADNNVQPIIKTFSIMINPIDRDRVRSILNIHKKRCIFFFNSETHKQK